MSTELGIQTVDEYIVLLPEDVGAIIQNIRLIVKELAPNVSEALLYGMPAYKTFGKPLVYFAACAKHIGFYATPTGHKKFAEALASYKQGKGSVQFPLNKPIPYQLIRDMVAFRVSENEVLWNKR